MPYFLDSLVTLCIEEQWLKKADTPGTAGGKNTGLLSYLAFMKKKDRDQLYGRNTLREDAEGILKDTRSFIKGLKRFKYEHAFVVKGFWTQAAARGKIDCNPLEGWDIDILNLEDHERFFRILRMVQQDMIPLEKLADTFCMSERNVERMLRSLLKESRLPAFMVPEKKRIIEDSRFGFGFSIHPFMLSLNMTQLLCLFKAFQDWMDGEGNEYREAMALLGSIFWLQASPYAKERLVMFGIQKERWNEAVKSAESELETARRSKGLSLIYAVKNRKPVTVRMVTGMEMRGTIKHFDGDMESCFKLEEEATGDLIPLNPDHILEVSTT